MAKNEMLGKSGTTFRHGGVFPTKQLLYEKEASYGECKNVFTSSLQYADLPVQVRKLPHLW